MTRSRPPGPISATQRSARADDAENLKLSRLRAGGLDRLRACSGCWPASAALQFVTRYFLNDSFAWTEEIARYLLMCLTFVGGGMAVRALLAHPRRLLLPVPAAPARAARASMLVDVLRIAFFAYATWLCWKITQIMEPSAWRSIELPMNIVFGMCTFGFVVMTLRAIQVTVMQLALGHAAPAASRVHAEGRKQ